MLSAVPALVLSGLLRIVGLVGGPVVYTGLATWLVGVQFDKLNAKQGHKPGETVFTPRVGGDDGVHISGDSASELGQILATLTAFPALSRFAGMRFFFTASEAELVLAMAVPMFRKLEQMLACARAGDGETLEVLNQEFIELAKPLELYLERFPAVRKTSS